MAENARMHSFVVENDGTLIVRLTTGDTMSLTIHDLARIDNARQLADDGYTIKPCIWTHREAT